MKNSIRIFALIALGSILATAAKAAPVTFWFSGYVTSVNNPTNALPFPVAVGEPFTGRFSYDPSLVGYKLTYNYGDGDFGVHYFTNTSGLSLVFQLAGHVITNGLHANYSTCGEIYVTEGHNNTDAFEVYSGKQLFVDGSSYLTPQNFTSLSVNLFDATKTALTSTDLQTNPPVLANFPTSRDLRWGAYIDNGGPTLLFAVSGVVTNLSTTEQLWLNFRRPSVGTVQLGWPLAIPGFTLEYTTDLPSDNWQTVTNAVADINAEHTVTLPIAGGTRFFRLKK